MKGQQHCGNCRYYNQPPVQAEDFRDHGRCRLHPPVRLAVASNLRPAVGENDWCGQWVADQPANFGDTALALAKSVLVGDATAALALADHLQELNLRVGTDGNK